MYRIGVQLGFSAAHYHGGGDPACDRIHGHNYRVELEIASNTLKSGMVIDFKRVRRRADDVLQEYDHCLLNESPDFRGIEPTTENISRILYEKIKPFFSRGPARIHRITVWETNDCWASYEEGEGGESVVSDQ